MMQTYKELYFHLFNTLTDAITDLEQGQVLPAIHRMKLAQQAAEEVHLETDILPDVSLPNRLQRR